MLSTGPVTFQDKKEANDPLEGPPNLDDFLN